MTQVDWLRAQCVRLLTTLEDLLFPAQCLACGEEDGDWSFGGLCPGCVADLPVPPPVHPPPGADSVVAAAAFEPPVNQLIYRLKYGCQRGAAVPLGCLLEQAVRRAGPAVDCLVPVPQHFLKRWSRGLDHTGLLAEELAAGLGLPVWRGLRRVRMTIAQGQAADGAQRRRQVAGAFACRGRLRGRAIGLVDDLLTTGATASACSACLRRAGAGSVHLLVAAAARGDATRRCGSPP